MQQPRASDSGPGDAGAAHAAPASAVAAASLHQTQLKDHFKVVKRVPTSSLNAKSALRRPGQLSMPPVPACSPGALPAAPSVTPISRGLGFSMSDHATDSATTYGLHGPWGSSGAGGTGAAGMAAWGPQAPAALTLGMGAEDSEECGASMGGEAADDSDGCPSVCQIRGSKRPRRGAQASAAPTASLSEAAITGAVCAGGGRASSRRAASSHGAATRPPAPAPAPTAGGRGRRASVASACLGAAACLQPPALEPNPSAATATGTAAACGDDDLDDEVAGSLFRPKPLQGLDPLPLGPMRAGPMPAATAAAPAMPCAPWAPWASGGAPRAQAARPAPSQACSDATDVRGAASGPMLAADRWGDAMPAPFSRGGAAQRRARAASARGPAASTRSGASGAFAPPPLPGGFSLQISSATVDDDCSDDAVSTMRGPDAAGADAAPPLLVSRASAAAGSLSAGARSSQPPLSMHPAAAPALLAGPPAAGPPAGPAGTSAAPGTAVGAPPAARAPLLLDDPLEGVPWAGPAEERPDFYQSRYEQLLHGINLVPLPMRAPHDDEE